LEIGVLNLIQSAMQLTYFTTKLKPSRSHMFKERYRIMQYICSTRGATGNRIHDGPKMESQYESAEIYKG